MTRIESFTYLADWDEACGCPMHGNRCRKVYTFGRYGDASVCTFRGCGCAVCTNEASLLGGVALGHEVTYHTSYNEAAGRAKLIVIQEAIDNQPFA